MVKRIGYLHDKLCTEKNIALADKNARIGKKDSRKYIREHDKNRKQEDIILFASFVIDNVYDDNNDITYD